MSLDSFMNRANNIVNILSLALGKDSASKRQIILSVNNEKAILPVTPPKVMKLKQHKIMKQ